MFNANKNTYDIETILKKKTENLLKVIPEINFNDIELFINQIKKYMCEYTDLLTKKYKDVVKDYSILPIIEKNGEELLKDFDYNKFNQIIKSNNEIELKFNDNEDIREKILNIVLLSIIKDGGKTKGPELSLLFSKVFINLGFKCLPEYSMRYASYQNGIIDDNYIRFVNAYMDLPYSTSYIYLLPDYFDSNIKKKYNVEDLTDILKEYEKLDEYGKSLVK